MADAQDLKSCDPNRSYRFDPGLRHQKRISDVKASHCRGVEQLVARRAHNPEAAGSNPVPATTKSTRGQNGFGFYNALKTAVFQYLQRFLKTDTDAYKYHIKVKNWGYYWGFSR